MRIDSTWVLTIDDVRYDSMRTHLDTWGVAPHRFNGYRPSVAPAVWRRPVADPARSLAIIRSYRHLLNYLRDRTHETAWLVTQDDICFASNPTQINGDADLHLLGGYKTRGPYKSSHVHPLAFAVTRDVVDDLIDCWRDETRQVCESWTRIITPERCSYADPVIAVEA